MPQNNPEAYEDETAPAAAPVRPKLKQGETQQSASYQKRFKAYQREVQLAEVTAYQAKIHAEEAKARAERDVLAEVSQGVADANTDATPKPAATAKQAGKVKDDGILAPATEGLSNRQAKLDAAEGASN